MLDTVGNRSLSDCRRMLTPKGIFVSCSGGKSGTRWLARMVWMLVSSRFTTRKLKPFIVSLNRPDLLALTQLVEAGKIKPFIERRYPLSAVADALRHVGEGHAQGQTVIQVVT
jgi:NADPH:quinone reductase-like Zn-dependent oxidoreductase